MRSRAWAALALALASAAVPRARAEVAERILAVVEGSPVLLSEVQLLERLRGVDRAAALEAVIDEWLMFREASRLAQTALSPEQEERAFEGLRESAGGAGNEAELRRLARRQAAILHYVEFRFGAQVRVDDETVRREWDTAHPGGGEMTDDEADRLRRALAARELDEKIEAWVRELRAAADVRYNP